MIYYNGILYFDLKKLEIHPGLFIFNSDLKESFDIKVGIKSTIKTYTYIHTIIFDGVNYFLKDEEGNRIAYFNIGVINYIYITDSQYYGV